MSLSLILYASGMWLLSAGMLGWAAALVAKAVREREAAWAAYALVLAAGALVWASLPAAMLEIDW